MEDRIASLRLSLEDARELFLSLDAASKDLRCESDVLVMPHGYAANFSVDAIGDSRPNGAWRRLQLCEVEKALRASGPGHYLAAAWWKLLRPDEAAAHVAVDPAGKRYRVSPIRLFSPDAIRPVEIWLAPGHPEAPHYELLFAEHWPGVAVKSPKGTHGNDRDPKLCYARTDIEREGETLGEFISQRLIARLRVRDALVQARGVG